MDLALNTVTMPYKFLIVLPELTGVYKWHRFWEKKNLWAGVKVKDSNIRLGMLLNGRERTYRVDISHGFFLADNLHRSRQSIRSRVLRTFGRAKVKKMSPGSTIVMIWTNSLGWLDDKKARLNMEAWNGKADEPRSIWRAAASARKWSS